MKTRIITGIILLCILLPVLFFANTWVLPIAISICQVIGLFEMLRCIGLHKKWAISIPFYILGTLSPIAIRLRFLWYNSLSNEQAEMYSEPLITIFNIGIIIVLISIIYFFAMGIFSRNTIQINDIGTAFLSLLYIFIGFNGILLLHDIPHGNYIYLMIFICAWTTDVFAYFCGMLFGRGGKHKLCPEVSPKKTVEGSIGGIVFCTIAMIVYGIILTNVLHQEITNLWKFAVGGLIASIVAQIGDLSMSLIKRHYNIKDYGKIFPGHGGMMDRFDSILAVTIILLSFNVFFPMI